MIPKLHPSHRAPRYSADTQNDPNTCNDRSNRKYEDLGAREHERCCGRGCCRSGCRSGGYSGTVGLVGENAVHKCRFAA